MKKALFWGLGTLLPILGLATVGGQGVSIAPEPAGAQAGIGPQVRTDFGRLPLHFIENRGRLDSSVAFYVQGRDKTLYFTSEGVTYALAGKDRRWVVKMDFVGASPTSRPRGEEEREGTVSYFKGSPGAWRTGLPTWARIVYRELWSGIDLAYSGTVHRLKSELTVKPGADPDAIRFVVRGASEVRLNESGALDIETPEGGFQDAAPEAWQDVEGTRRAVPASYAFDAASKEIAFKVGSYDATRPLVIDPAIIIYCGFIGGTGDDWGRGIAVDAWNHAYVTGSTSSSESDGFPAAVGPDPSYNGTGDAFVAKLRADGAGFVYCGYIGGDDNDVGYGIAIDGFGCAYITGLTGSSEASFPVYQGPDLTYNGGAYDAFVAKINAFGTGLAYCGYIGGAARDEAHGIALDGAMNAYLTGITWSDQTSFPVTVGPDLTFDGGTNDAFVAKVNAAGAGLIYCGYLGDGGADEGRGIAVDGAGSAYVTGTLQIAPAFTDTNAFVAKINPAGTAPAYVFSLGGTSFDAGNGIAVDEQGCAYVAGETSSDESSFPVKTGPDLTANGVSDAFVAKLNAAGSALAYCGYLGGSASDYGRGIAVDGAGNAYIAGETYSGEASFPVQEGPDLTFNGSGDAFVAKLTSSGGFCFYCGYVGGSGEDFCTGIAIDGGGNAYIVGSAESSSGDDFPVRTGPDLTYNEGLYDAFVAKVSGGDWLRLTAPNGGEKWMVGSEHAITWLTSDLIGLNKLVYSTNGGQTWKQIVFATPDDGSYLWTVPHDVSNTVWVRVAEREGPGYDRSNRVFAIVPQPTLRVIAPNGGEKWTAGTTHTIRWRTTGTVGRVKISYSIDKGLNWTNIHASTPNTGRYAWRVPRRPSTKCRVRIWEAGDRTPSDISDSVFTIKAD
jgi:hypothetical protein